MSLVECADCGAKISKRAEACPSCGAPVESPTGARVKDALLAFFIVAVAIGSVWVIVEITIGRAGAARLYHELFGTRAELTNETVTVLSDEFRGVLLTVPYPGTVTLEVASLGGESVDVHLIDGADLLRLAGKKPPLSALKLGHHAAFQSHAAPSTTLSGHLVTGKYVVVLEHSKRGAPASDVRVVAKLAP